MALDKENFICKWLQKLFTGPALMAMSSKALPLTASCLSPLSLGLNPEKSENVASDLGI